ncbi:MAG: hypothetical protein J6K72_06815 [Clostridia bacterium]|nr:hypothetical protein [Clostridia bacterium]
MGYLDKAGLARVWAGIQGKFVRFDKAMSLNATQKAQAVANIGALTSSGTVDNANKLGGKTYQEIVNAIYPVGSLFFSMNATSPASLFGGSWTQITDKFIYAAGSNYYVGQTGGAQTVSLSIANLPYHTHGMRMGWSDNLETVNSVITTVERQGLTAGTAESHVVVDAGYTTNAAGSGTAHTNMPPFVAAYIWQRTA